MIQAGASAKIILSGEHAVVYGYPAIAVPVPALRATASIQPSAKNTPLRIQLPDINQEIIGLTDTEHPAVKIIQLVLEHLKKAPFAITITAKSDIPIAGGMGSGAAISTAIARALFAYFKQEVNPSVLNSLVYEVEKMHHGTPSGIDNTVIVYDAPVYFVRGKPVQVMQNVARLHLLIADTGTRAPTKESVGDVRKLYEQSPENTGKLLESMGEITTQIYAAMQSQELEKIGQLMTKNHELLRDLTVSSEKLDAMVENAIAAGAMGAKLSGGGRGGNMIALVSEEAASAVKAALLNIGATQIFETYTGASI